MSEETEAAPEASGGDATPIADAPAASSAPSEPAASAADAVEQAFSEVFDEKPTEAKSEEQAPSGGDRERDEKGRFKKAADQESAADQADEAPAEVAEEEPATEEPEPVVEDAPPGFTEAAKAAWAKADPALRADVTRSMGEMQTGLQQYQQAFEPLKPYAQLAQQAGKDLPKLMSEWWGAEQVFRSDPIRGFQHVAQQLGLDLEDVAMQILEGGGAPPQQQAPQVDQRYQQLEQRYQQLEQRIDQRDREIAEQRVIQEIETFKASAPRFAELEPMIAAVLQSPLVPQNLPPAERLKLAYGHAERLKPAPAPAAPAQPKPPKAQTPRAASLSVSGAPANGSNPTRRRPAASAGDALDQAFAELNL